MCSNNTNKLSPQEHSESLIIILTRSNNTNKLSPQERVIINAENAFGSNNTNKLSPQEHHLCLCDYNGVQIIQINLVLKNRT